MSAHPTAEILARRIEFFVFGLPAPQGSKRHVGNGIMVESCKALKPWRDSVIWAAREAKLKANFAGWDECPVAVEIYFYLPRPKSTPKRVIYPIRKPDVDKLERAILDALTISGLIDDDARVVDLAAHKRFAGGMQHQDVPGAFVSVRGLR